MFLFPFYLKKKKRIISFLERAGTSGSLALSCAGLHRVRFAHFCSRPFQFLTLSQTFFFSYRCSYSFFFFL